MSSQTPGLRKAMAVGAVWVTALRSSHRLLGLISTVILARLLTPDDFGLVAIAMSFFALIEVFSRLGLETVLIQKTSPSIEHYNTAWTLNLILGIFSAAALIAASGLIAEFYDSKEVQNVLWAISLLFLLNGLKNIGVVDFQKDLTFNKEFKLYFVPKFCSFFITIAIALIYRSYWALVIGTIIWRFLEVMMSYYMHPHRPSFCLKESRDLFHFSKWLVVNNFLAYVLRNSPDLILGKLISFQATAIYGLAQEIGSAVSTELISNLNRAIFPGYSKVSSETDKLKLLYEDTIRIIAIIATPLGVGTAMIASYLVPVLLGDQWLNAIEPLVYLSLSGSFYALSSNNAYIFFALAKPKIVTGLTALRCVLFCVLMYFLIPLNGVTGAAQAFLITGILGLFISNLMIIRELKFGYIQQLNFYVRPIIAALFMSIIIFSTMHYSDFSNIINLILCIFLGALSYTFSIYILWLLSGKDGPESMLVDFFLKKIGKK